MQPELYNIQLYQMCNIVGKQYFSQTDHHLFVYVVC